MKLVFISDIHGSLTYLERALERVEAEKPDQIVLLGDLLYHGPRNPLPEGYAPAEVLKRLNAYKERLVCVRGNCDSEVDQMVLQFPIRADYAMLYVDGLKIFATHGHIYSAQELPPLSEGNILIHGHTHIPVAERLDKGVYLLNPGSIALPKENHPHTYGVLEDGAFAVRTLDGEDYMNIVF